MSPISPVLQPCPAALVTRTDTPGSGKPALPARRSPSTGLEVSIAVSLMP